MANASAGESIFSVMSALAAKYDAVNLSQGFPDFPTDTHLQECLRRAASGNHNQYMPSPGYLPLREKIAGIISTTYGRTSEPNEILITAGATQAIFTAIQALVAPGDEVLILDPAYDCYDMPVALRNAVPVHVNLTDEFLPDWELIFSRVTMQTKMIIINNPHNPGGRCWSAADFDKLEELCEMHPQLLILSDEVYEHISLSRPHISVHSRPRLWGNSVVVSSFGKTFHITGWKMGYLAAPIDLMEKIKKVHQYVVFSVNSVAQAALSDYLQTADLTEPARTFLAKRDKFRSLLKETNFELMPCDGSYFQVASFGKISGAGDLDFCRQLVTDHGVAAIPLSVFYADGTDRQRIRFCFAKSDQTLERAAELLSKL